MIKLTDADRKRIAAIFANVPDGADFSIPFQREAIYRAGIAAGLERAAQTVENGRFLTDTAPVKLWADQCAAAIRALLK